MLHLENAPEGHELWEVAWQPIRVQHNLKNVIGARPANSAPVMKQESEFSKFIDNHHANIQYFLIFTLDCLIVTLLKFSY